MKSFCTYIFLFFGCFLAAQVPSLPESPKNRIPLRSLEQSKFGAENSKDIKTPITDANGNLRYENATDVLVTPLSGSVTITATGNPASLQGKFVGRNDSVWYVDYQGDGVLASGANSLAPANGGIVPSISGSPYKLEREEFTASNLPSTDGKGNFYVGNSAAVQFVRETGIEEENRIIDALRLGGDADTTTARHLRNFVRQMQAAGLWQKMFAVWPFLGTTEGQHSVNILHTSAGPNTWTHKMNFPNGATFGVGGVDFNGVNQYGEALGLWPGYKAYGISVFSNENIGSACAGKPYVSMKPDNTFFQDAFGLGMTFNATALLGRSHSVTNLSSGAIAATGGFYSIISTTNDSLLGYQNGSLVLQGTIAKNYPSANNARNIQINSGNNTATGTTTAGCQFFAVHGVLTASEAALLSNIVSAFQTALGRNGLAPATTYSRKIGSFVGESFERMQGFFLGDPVGVARDGAKGLWFPREKKLRIYGGWRGSSFTPNSVNEVLVSSDMGATWTVEAASSAWGPRHAYGLVVQNDTIFLVGGDLQNGGTGDAYFSTDGVTFTQRTNSAPFAGFHLGGVVAHDGSLFYVAGQPVADPNVMNRKVWRSRDGGATWQEIASNIPFIGHCDNQIVSFKGKIWVVGGTAYGSDAPGSTRVFGRNVWSSEDGISWRLEYRFPVGFSYGALTVWNGKMRLLAGASPNVDGDGGINGREMWSSSDGKSWTPQTYAGVLEDTHAACIIPVDGWGMFMPEFNLSEASYLLTEFVNLPQPSNALVALSSVATALPVKGTGTVGDPVTIDGTGVGGGLQILSSKIQLGGSNIAGSQSVGLSTSSLNFQNTFGGTTNLLINGATGRTSTADYFTATIGNLPMTFGGGLSTFSKIGSNIEPIGNTRIVGGTGWQIVYEGDLWKLRLDGVVRSSGAAFGGVDALNFIQNGGIQRIGVYNIPVNGEMLEVPGGAGQTAAKFGVGALARQTPVLNLASGAGLVSIHVTDRNPNAVGEIPTTLPGTITLDNRGYAWVLRNGVHRQLREARDTVTLLFPAYSQNVIAGGGSTLLSSPYSVLPQEYWGKKVIRTEITMTASSNVITSGSIDFFAKINGSNLSSMTVGAGVLYVSTNQSFTLGTGSNQSFTVGAVSPTGTGSVTGFTISLVIEK